MVSNSPLGLVPSDDEIYDAFGFPEFTEEDFAQIDRMQILPKAMTPNGDAEITIELETPPVGPPEVAVLTKGDGKEFLSPLQRNRRNGILSVTDLVSPAWCEVQFDYGLRQRRSAPIEKRPESFLSAEGKKISVEKGVAARNYATTRKGVAIHKVLERETRLEEVTVSVTTAEERWALRLVNLLACFRCMIFEGFMREIPVFGIVGDEIVVGIIDELAYRLPTYGGKDPSPHQNATSQLDLSRLADNDSTPLPSPHVPLEPGLTPHSNHHSDVLYLIDTKTRRSDSLPSHDDTLSSRLQLMLYHRLLSDLITTSPPFDFPSLWKRLGLDSSRVFSDRFIEQAGLSIDNERPPTACLDSLVTSWVNLILDMKCPSVSNHLQLVYRLQPNSGQWKRESKRTGTLRSPSNVIMSQEERDLATAIEASLMDARQPSDLAPKDTARVIGTKEFTFNRDLLDHHISDILDWWHGRRKPRGVRLEHCGRCFSCEYYTDCEWRDQKALEISGHRLKRMGEVTA
ncbi:exonuclease V [Infundibulicybe gibba]|nr:exonuclease V [Infundibulicybe gibba]